jgi:hypothetical protein
MNKFYCYILITLLTVLPFVSVHAELTQFGFVGRCTSMAFTGDILDTTPKGKYMTIKITYLGNQADQSDKFTISRGMFIEPNRSYSQYEQPFYIEFRPSDRHPITITVTMNNIPCLDKNAKTVFILEATGTMQGHKYSYDPDFFATTIMSNKYYDESKKCLCFLWKNPLPAM